MSPDPKPGEIWRCQIDAKSGLVVLARYADGWRWPSGKPVNTAVEPVSLLGYLAAVRPVLDPTSPSDLRAVADAVEALITADLELSREAASIVASTVSTYSPSFIRYRADRIERKQAEVAERDRLVAQARADLTADQDGWHQPTVDAVLVSMADAGWRPQEKARMSEYVVTVESRLRETYLVTADSAEEAQNLWSDKDPEQSEVQEMLDIQVEEADQ